MGYKEQLKKINKYEFELPKSGKMFVPGRIFISEKLLKNVEEEAINQIVNVAQLKGIVGHSFGMADIHSGYGFSIGGVAAFDLEKGIISPGGVGYDINCGVRVLATNITEKQLAPKTKQLLHDINRTIPSGVGRGNKDRLSKEQLNEILKLGAEWAVKNKMGTQQDLENCEESGKIKNANPADVSQRARARGMPQLGTLGAGNHFIEIQKIEQIYDDKIAKIFGLEKDNIVIMIHCGSRGLGHQVASDYIKAIEQEYGFANLPDRELINAPINSELGKKYISAMNCAVNFAFCNRQIIMHKIREVIKRYFPKSENHLVYDVAHNIAKFEEHKVNGENQTLCIHRKGATRSFGPGRKELPEIYKQTGQPVIIPGSMGTASYILVGTKQAEELSWGSTAHGAGRVMSRSQAFRTIKPEEVKQELKQKNIEIESHSNAGIVAEAPQVYKDIEEVIKVSKEVGLAKPVARLIPLGVIKG